MSIDGITEIATAAPGYTSSRPDNCAPLPLPLPLTLKLNSYSTAMLGKCHEVPVRENSPMGPFGHCPASATPNQPPKTSTEG